MDAGELFAGEYRLERLLGRGASAEVWLARDRDEILHVVKRLRGSASPELRERFVREHEVAQRLGPPHFCRWVAGAASPNGPCYIVWHDEPGKVLPEWLASAPAMRRRVEVLAEALKAVAALHAAGVIHRDLKPDHLLVGDSGSVVLLDLGLCRVDGGERLTASRHLLGTAPFVAPEQASSSHRVDVRTDLYSVGAIAFWLLCGRPPIWAPTAEALITLKLMRDAPLVSECCEHDVSTELDEWVAGMLARDPAARPPSAAAALTALTGTPECQ